MHTIVHEFDCLYIQAEVISMIEDRTHSPQDLARIREYKKQKEKEAKERKEREREPADETRYTRHR